MQQHWVAEADSYSPSEEEEEEDLFVVACEHLWENFHGLDRAYPRGKDHLPEDGE